MFTDASFVPGHCTSLEASDGNAYVHCMFADEGVLFVLGH